ncbi:hypothetical protein J6590_061034 [Homalodisca vitripennis]|nr:hypothetical protein J6590_061034 [Homalodisca vitripennis]
MQRAQSDVRPSRYINYRLVPTINDTTEFRNKNGPRFKRRRGFRTRKWRHALQRVSYDEWMATPCGHIVVCRLCAVSMTEYEIFHQVTNGDGTIYNAYTPATNMSYL